MMVTGDDIERQLSRRVAKRADEFFDVSERCLAVLIVVQEPDRTGDATHIDLDSVFDDDACECARVRAPGVSDRVSGDDSRKIACHQRREHHRGWPYGAHRVAQEPTCDAVVHRELGQKAKSTYLGPGLVLAVEGGSPEQDEGPHPVGMTGDERGGQDRAGRVAHDDAARRYEIQQGIQMAGDVIGRAVRLG